MGTVSVVGRWPMKGDPAAHIHDADCEGRRAWFNTPDDAMADMTLGDFPCDCPEREIAWIAHEGLRLIGADDWRTPAWEARRAKYLTRKRELIAYIAAFDSVTTDEAATKLTAAFTTGLSR